MQKGVRRKVVQQDAVGRRPTYGRTKVSVVFSLFFSWFSEVSSLSKVSVFVVFDQRFLGSLPIFRRCAFFAFLTKLELRRDEFNDYYVP